MSFRKNEQTRRTFNKEELKIIPKETIPVKRDKFNKGTEKVVERGKEINARE